MGIEFIEKMSDGWRIKIEKVKNSAVIETRMFSFKDHNGMDAVAMRDRIKEIIQKNLK